MILFVGAEWYCFPVGKDKVVL